MAEILNCHKVEGVAYSICLVVIGHDFVLADFSREMLNSSKLSLLVINIVRK
ncbi:MAG: hypothetical protein AB8V03_01355 [Francisella endosymbiont of Hyalomma asiaticum]